RGSPPSEATPCRGRVFWATSADRVRPSEALAAAPARRRPRMVQIAVASNSLCGLKIPCRRYDSVPGHPKFREYRDCGIVALRLHARDADSADEVTEARHPPPPRPDARIRIGRAPR